MIYYPAQLYQYRTAPNITIPRTLLSFTSPYPSLCLTELYRYYTGLHRTKHYHYFAKHHTAKPIPLDTVSNCTATLHDQTTQDNTIPIRHHTLSYLTNTAWNWKQLYHHMTIPYNTVNLVSHSYALPQLNTTVLHRTLLYLNTTILDFAIPYYTIILYYIARLHRDTAIPDRTLPQPDPARQDHTGLYQSCTLPHITIEYITIPIYHYTLPYFTNTVPCNTMEYITATTQYIIVYHATIPTRNTTTYSNTLPKH